MSPDGEIAALNLALICIGLGDHVRTIKILEWAYADNSRQVVWLKVDPIWDPLREEPRFKALIGRLGWGGEGGEGCFHNPPYTAQVWMTDCPFCNPDPDRVLLSSDGAYYLRDAFPVTAFHTLVIPRRHVADYFALSRDDLLACDAMLREAREHLLAQDGSISGFNIGVNVGSSAGQTIFHCHFHLIPRRVGDVENPRGGVRHIIPGRGDY